MTAPRIMVYVQHLLGIGHQMRTAAIVRAMQDIGLQVTVVSGGAPEGMPDLGNARLIQLPPAKATDASFSKLVDSQGNEIDDAWRTQRRDLLISAFHAANPAALLVESFPFGRWQFRFELIPLLRTARDSGTTTAVSVRDILVEKNKPGRNERIVAILREYFHTVLVHGDPTLVPFGATFPPATAIEDLIRYTGYVAPPRPEASPDGPGKGEVIVAAGGGAVGGKLLRTAVAARPMTAASEAPWRLIAGPNLPVQERAALSESPGIIIDSLRTDYRELLCRAALSVSQAGYNTVMDVLVTGVPAVLVPFAAPGETEQGLRAALLADRGRVHLADETDLTPDSLAFAVDRALAGSPVRPVEVALSGAGETAAIVKALAGR